MAQRRVVIIGAGVAGLASAALLAHAGFQVQVLESQSRIGGRAGVFERDGFRFDTGPSWYLMPRVFEHFFNLLGTSTARELDLVTLDAGYRVFSEPGPSGRAVSPVDIPHGEQAVRRVFDELEPGAGTELARYLVSARQTLDLAEKYFLYNPFQAPTSLLNGDVLRHLNKLAPLLGSSLEKFVGRRFRHPLLQKILGYPAVFLGTHPAQAPAMYHLMSALDLDDGVHYPRGGFWALMQKLEQLAQQAGAEIITGAEVERIETTNSRVRHVRGVTWRDSAGAAYFQPADIVVSAADLHHTETQLLSEAERTYPQRWWDKKQSGPGAVLTLLGVRGNLPQLAHHSLFFTRDWDENFAAIFGSNPKVPDPASLYVCRASATDPDTAPPGHEQLFVLTPVPADPEIGAGGAQGAGDPEVEATATAAVRQIAHWAKIPDLEQRIVLRQTIGPADFARDFHAWSGGMLGPSHVLSQSAMFRAQNASKKVAGLYYAGGSTAPGIGVPMCLISAELVLKRIRGDVTPGPLQVGEL